jgi:hypothetical protein
MSFVVDCCPVAFWGDTFVSASQLADQRWVLDAVFTASFDQGCVIPWRGFPLAAYTDGLGHYALAVVEYDDPLLAARCAESSFIYKQLEYAVYKLDTGVGLLTLRDVSASTAVASTTRFRGMPLALNSTPSILFVPAGITSFDEDSFITVNGQTLLIRRVGNVWYLTYATIS